eukprot:jgi/Phyca11/16422/fgenesh1_pg.PHYCAscaffold_20_\
MSVRDLRLTGLGGRASTIHNRSRSDSRVSKLSRTSSRYITKGKKRKDSNALSTITENWNLADDQFRSPFSEFDAQEQPIREELQRGLAIINDHTVGEILENDSLVTDVESLICFQTKLKEIDDAITAAMSEVWGYWAHYGEEGEVKGGEDEVHIGRMLVFFQDISNFMDRCNAITINMINQLAILSLTKKSDILLQFPFDEYIKSYLQREKRWYKKHRDDKEVDNKNPFDRAFQFNKDIRKLGVSNSGKTCLDQFRMLITEIGNALGYVRMVRSAGMGYCSNAIKFVPDLNHTHFKFEAYAGDGVAEEKNKETGEVLQDEMAGAKLSPETVEVARNLDSVMSTLAKNFSENNDYFKGLVKVFQDVTASDEQKHLVHFYAIIPALAINYVETTVTVEDNFYAALIMFGQARHGEEGEVKGGEDEVHIGRMLAFFQDISNFMDRCNAITINMINQLASLYQSFQKLWKSTFKLVHLHPVFDVLASLLEVMITIDAIVIDSPNIITSWDKY